MIAKQNGVSTFYLSPCKGILKLIIFFVSMISETRNLAHQDPEKDNLDLDKGGIAKKNGMECKICIYITILILTLKRDCKGNCYNIYTQIFSLITFI